MPSHAELEENYKTVVSSDTKASPVAVLPPFDAQRIAAAAKGNNPV